MQTKNTPFFFLTFFLFGSVITNAIGYYFIVLLYPLIYVVKYQVKIPTYVKHIGYLLLAIYISFVVSNFLNFFFPNSHIPLGFYQKNFNFFKLLKSRMPTSYLTTGIFFLLLCYISNKYCSKYSTVRHRHVEFLAPLETFFKGALWAGLFFSVFFLLEYVFRFQYREILKLNFLSDPYLKQFSFRRPEGFLANSLTLASMSLAYFCFFYVYFCACFFGEKQSKFLPFSEEKKKLFSYTLLPALLFFFILFLTVARLAILISFCFLLFIPLFFISRRNFFKIFVFVFVLALIAGVMSCKLGYTERILNSFYDYKTNGHIDNRAYFREIYTRMFLDKPWIGNGYYWLVHGIRDKYFILMGYGDLNERNYPAHNFYLEVLASGGVFCMSILFYGMARIFAVLKTLIVRHHRENNILWIAFFLSIIANLIHAWTQNNFLEASTTYTYLYLFFMIFWNTFYTSNKTFR